MRNSFFLQTKAPRRNPSNSRKVGEKLISKDNDKIVLGLDIPKTAAQINSDLKKLNKQLSAVRIPGSFDDSLKDAGQTLRRTENSMRTIDRLGASFRSQMSQAAETISKCLSLNTVVTLFLSKTKNAVKELRQVDTLLTQISVSNERLSRSDLERIGNNAFSIAGKYGRSAADYLTGVQEALRAGYRNAEAISELSLAAQTAGSMTAELARQMILTADQAFHMNGSVTKLTEALDGMHEIAGRNTIAMADIAEGIAGAGPAAESLGVSIGQTAAALSTMIAATRQGGQKTADALRSILLYTGQVKDEEKNINADGLASYEAACEALNVRLKETRNGILSLRDPMIILEELSAAYHRLDENDPRRTGLLNAVGSAVPAAQLDALLSGWDTYETMLGQYTDGAGSMADAAEKTARSWEGSLARLSNTWTDTLNHIVDSDAVVTAAGSLNSLLSVINQIMGALGSFGTAGLGVGIGAFVKNFA